MPFKALNTENLAFLTKGKRSQSALEYMMTYGWAILIIVIVAVTLYSMGIFNPSSSITTTSVGFSPFTVSSTVCSPAGLSVAIIGGGLPDTATQATITKIYITSNTGTTALTKAYTLNPVTISPGKTATIVIPTVACTSANVKYSLSAKLQYSYSTPAGNVDTNTTGTIAGTSSSNPIVKYVPLTITSSTATPAPFQQMVIVNMNNYNSYASSNLSNIEFTYPNGTIIPSWRENGTSNSQTVVYWIKLGSFTTTIVYMDFFSTSSNVLNTVNTGEAPQLSSTYAEYDDGQNVFLSYGDFLNTSGFGGWTPYVTAGKFTPIATSSGIEMTNDTVSEGTHILPPKPLAEEPVIVEYSWDFYGGSSPTDGEILSLFGDTSSITGPPVVECGGGNVASADSVMLMVEPVGMNCSGKYLPAILDNVNDKIISTINDLPSITPQTYTEELIVSNSTTAEAGVINRSSSLSNFSIIDIPITMSGSIPYVFNYPTLMVAAGTGGGYDYNYARWLVARAYPPNGVMPSVSFGSVA